MFRRSVAYYQNEPLSPSRKQHSAPRVVLDGMLGSLARRLRLLGYDAIYENGAEDRVLARRARAEGRVLLTRDHELAGRRGLRTLLIGSDVLEMQVREVLAALPIAPSDRTPRCSQCNGRLALVERAEIANRVPPFILRSHSEFRQCSGCARVYWPGSHFRAIRASMDRYDDEGQARD